MATYHYTECGLTNVVLVDVDLACDDAGEECVTLPNILGLHRAIAEGIVNAECGISGRELRFLRTEMGLTQAELADVLHKERVTITRWESGSDIDPNAETVIRLLACERLGLNAKPIAEMASWSVAKAAGREMRIDGHDPSNWKLAA